MDHLAADDQVWIVDAVCCRGDREIDWIEITNNNVEGYRKLRDMRFVDPVWCQQTRINSGDGAYLLTLTDFKGRKVLNYRIGEASIKKQKFPISDGKTAKPAPVVEAAVPSNALAGSGPGPGRSAGGAGRAGA